MAWVDQRSGSVEKEWEWIWGTAAQSAGIGKPAECVADRSRQEPVEQRGTDRQRTKEHQFGRGGPERHPLGLQKANQDPEDAESHPGETGQKAHHSEGGVDQEQFGPWGEVHHARTCPQAVGKECQ